MTALSRREYFVRANSKFFKRLPLFWCLLFCWLFGVVTYLQCIPDLHTMYSFASAYDNCHRWQRRIQGRGILSRRSLAFAEPNSPEYLPLSVLPPSYWDLNFLLENVKFAHIYWTICFSFSRSTN